jgi:galactofuranose transport system ATP-binding protein
VMRNGEREGEYACSELSRLTLVNKMIGSADGAAAAPEAPVPATPGEPVLVARGLARKGALAPLDFDIRAGEMLGLCGLLGSGRTETARLLFGADRADGGSIRMDGHAGLFANPRERLPRASASVRKTASTKARSSNCRCARI